MDYWGFLEFRNGWDVVKGLAHGMVISAGICTALAIGLSGVGKKKVDPNAIETNDYSRRIEVMQNKVFNKVVERGEGRRIVRECGYGLPIPEGQVRICLSEDFYALGRTYNNSDVRVHLNVFEGETHKWHTTLDVPLDRLEKIVATTSQVTANQIR